MINFKMTVRADCAISTCRPPPSIYKRPCPLFVSGWSRPIPLVDSIQNKAKFPFNQVCLFIDFWAVSSQTPTFWHSNNHFNCRLPSNQRLVGGQPFHLTYNNSTHDSGWKNKDGVSQKYKIGGMNYSREKKGSEGKKKKKRFKPKTVKQWEWA